MSNNTDYKDSLNLPRTGFPMKADLPKREPEFLSIWESMDIYSLITAKPAPSGKYILHDGPPYANGDIHIGHALNKTLKDIVVKFKTMQGFDSRFVPGWDCHGLPIEHQLFKELKINKSQISQIEFRKKAYDYAMKFVSNQKGQFKRLGVFGEWENPYLTLSHEYEETIVASFYELFRKGYIKRGLKPVNWCYKCETALAEAEVEYEDHVSPSVYVKFKLSGEQPANKIFNETTPATRHGGSDDLCGGKQRPPQDMAGPPSIMAEDNETTYLVIWTTTPWTLIANVAVALHPELRYSYIKTDKGNLVIGTDLLAQVLEKSGIEKYELIKEFEGRELEGLVYEHPFALRKGKVVTAGYVSKEDGTGLVHTAPGHGSEDYLTGLKYNLEIIMPVDARGRFDQTAGEFSGQNVYEANKLIVEKLKNIGSLLYESKISHSYPHCWRCKSPIIFRATKQWFMLIDHDNLREKLLRAIRDEVKWVPSSGEERIASMVELRPDWCLSRQRYWGVPVPALVCEECREEFFDPGTILNFAKIVAGEGSDCWFTRDVSDFTPKGLTCPACNKGKSFLKGRDILDVWFDSGVSHQAVLKKRPELKGTPCELYLEGSDQHRGWFQSSLIPSIAIDSRPPYKCVLTHGHVVDSEGRKMSKSMGNVISPQEIIKEYGADILRLWVASSDYNLDIRISKEMLKRLSEAYRKIRNTARFILSNLYDFNPDTDKAPYEDLKRIDKWILFRLEETRRLVSDAYEKFEFYKAYKMIYDFCNEDLSMYYLDMVKGRLYTFAAGSVERRAAQTAMYEALSVLVRLMAPVLVFSAEEIWQNMPKEKKDTLTQSVHLSDWPKPNPVPKQDEFDSVIGLIPAVAKKLEEKRSLGEIGSSFDAKINLLTKDEIRYKYLESLSRELPEVFKASQVCVCLDKGASSEVEARVDKADGAKCVRCWNYSHHVGKDKEHPGVCERCLRALRP